MKPVAGEFGGGMTASGLNLTTVIRVSARRVEVRNSRNRTPDEAAYFNRFFMVPSFRDSGIDLHFSLAGRFDLQRQPSDYLKRGCVVPLSLELKF
ncbi:MAG TPA: hypothetical protein VJ302_28415 [Blastocatellia bacterium]|nr:hypothetical protein [Blastocatellia bacterium]